MKRDKGPLKDEKYDEVSYAGITLRAYHGFKDNTRADAPAICEEIASRKKEILQILKFIDKMERKNKRWLAVEISLTDPEEDMKRWDEKKPAHPAGRYRLNIHFVDSWAQRKNIYESYEIALWDELEPTAIYVHPRLLDKVYTK